ncbi:MAG: SpoIIIAH-like family protein [Limnochordia bacterium]|nr:SpoIIIAH-like family protein [Limnochordia bacterium]
MLKKSVPTTAGLSTDPLTTPTGSQPGEQKVQQLRPQYVLERERNRSRQMAFLQGLLEDPNLSSEQRREIEQKTVALMERWTLELELENMLVVNGYSEPVVLLSDDGVSVMISEVLNGEGASLLGDLVARICSLPKTSIVIMDGRQ